MVPVIKSLGAGGPAGFLPVLAWGLSMGTDIGGSATPIGASANVVGSSVAEKEGHRIGWGKYCKAAVPATLIVVVISMIVIFIRYGDLLMMEKRNPSRYVMRYVHETRGLFCVHEKKI